MTSRERFSSLCPFYCLLFAVLAAISAGQKSTAIICLEYEPKIVRLQGEITRRTFPGPPNYESVRKGDRPETSLLLKLDKPICVDQDPKNPDLNSAQKNVSIVQLVMTPQLYRSSDNLVGQQVVATGTLFAAHTGHHHTPILMTVTTLAKR